MQHKCSCTGRVVIRRLLWGQIRKPFHDICAVLVLQEVQLYTADADQYMTPMGLRTPLVNPLSEPQSKDHAKADSDSPENGGQQCHQTRTHCSANSMQAQGHLQGIAGRPATAGATAKQGAKMREASADSEEVKRGASSDRSGGSPHSRSPGSLGPCRLSTTQRQHSGDLQTGSGG